MKCHGVSGSSSGYCVDKLGSGGQSTISPNEGNNNRGSSYSNTAYDRKGPGDRSSNSSYSGNSDGGSSNSVSSGSTTMYAITPQQLQKIAEENKRLTAQLQVTGKSLAEEKQKVEALTKTVDNLNTRNDMLTPLALKELERMNAQAKLANDIKAAEARWTQAWEALSTYKPF